MSLRDFLLDYAEKAPKAMPVSGTTLRFVFPGPFAHHERRACPLELCAGVLGLHEAIKACGIDEATGLLISYAADGGAIGRSMRPEERAWRAILEKIAKPDEARP